MSQFLAYKVVIREYDMSILTTYQKILWHSVNTRMRERLIIFLFISTSATQHTEIFRSSFLLTTYQVHYHEFGTNFFKFSVNLSCE